MIRKSIVQCNRSTNLRPNKVSIKKMKFLCKKSDSFSPTHYILLIALSRTLIWALEVYFAGILASPLLDTYTPKASTRITKQETLRHRRSFDIRMSSRFICDRKNMNDFLNLYMEGFCLQVLKISNKHFI